MIISVRTNLAEFTRGVADFQRRQIPFAAARALTDTANAAKAAITAELPRIFDRPTPFTQRAVQVIPANKGNLRAVVTVYPKQAEYLALEQTGGTRTPEGNPGKAAKALLEPRGIRLNQYGNIPAGALARLLLNYQGVVERRKANVAARKAAAKGDKRAAARAVTSGMVYVKGGTKQAHGHVGGLFRLTRNGLVRLTGFTGEAHYQARFDFHGRVGVVVARVFNGAMVKRMAEAVASARP